jgi:hypothetical protein
LITTQRAALGPPFLIRQSAYSIGSPPCAQALIPPSIAYASAAGAFAINRAALMRVRFATGAEVNHGLSVGDGQFAGLEAT